MLIPVIRPQRPADAEVVREVLTSSFGRAQVADLAEALQARANGRSFVAEIDGQVVGEVLLSRSWLDASDRLVEVLVLSPLGVRPEFQRQGIGGHLVRHAVAQARTAGAALLFLEGDPAYYARFGFARAGERGFTAPSVRVPDAAFQVVVLPAWEASMTGALVYAEPFWAFDCVGLRPR